MYSNSKFRRRENKLTIYIARYKSSDKQTSGHSAPCSSCLKKIKKIGIKKIVYVNENGEIINCLSKNFNTDYISSGYREYMKKNINVI